MVSGEPKNHSFAGDEGGALGSPPSQRNHPAEPQHPALGTTPSLAPAVSPTTWGPRRCSAWGQQQPVPVPAELPLGPTRTSCPNSRVGAIERASRRSQPAPPPPFSPPGKAEKLPCEMARPPLCPGWLNIIPQIRGGQLLFQVVMLWGRRGHRRLGLFVPREAHSHF